jgi:hypothetical protein
MEHQLILRLLFVRGMTAIFLVGELGVVDEQNGLRESQILLQVLFMWFDQRRSMQTKPKNGFLARIKKIPILIPPFLLISFGTRRHRSRSMCEHAVLTLKLYIKLRCVDVAEITNTMHWFVPLLYSIYWLLHVSAIVCHNQGTSWILLSYFNLLAADFGI